RFSVFRPSRATWRGNLAGPSGRQPATGRPTTVRVLAITKIFPNAAEPLSAPFNRQQFAALAKRCELEVMATIPWFPGAGLLSRWSSAGRLAQVPRREQIAGIEVSHPRTLFLPRLPPTPPGP